MRSIIATHLTTFGLTLALATAALVLAGCGGDAPTEAPGASGPQGPTSDAPDRDLTPLTTLEIPGMTRVSGRTTPAGAALVYDAAEKSGAGHTLRVRVDVQACAGPLCGAPSTGAAARKALAEQHVPRALAESGDVDIAMALIELGSGQKGVGAHIVGYHEKRSGGGVQRLKANVYRAAWNDGSLLVTVQVEPHTGPRMRSAEDVAKALTAEEGRRVVSHVMATLLPALVP